MSYQVEPALASDEAAIEHLLDLSFGLSRRSRTSYRLREGNTAIKGLSLVVREPGAGLVGAISFWPLRIGPRATPALLLGPLAVHPERQNLGIGLKLMQEGLTRAAKMGHRLVILVGDEPYYARVGFKRLPEGRLSLPGPVDPNRFLYLELVEGALGEAEGLVLAPWRAASPAVQRPSRYHMEESSRSSVPSARRVANSGMS
jgi:predicted N-acetyltransferase YhbS